MVGWSSQDLELVRLEPVALPQANQSVRLFCTAGDNTARPVVFE